MVFSMTGFASLTQEDEIAVIDVTARSVNHRFLDIKAETVIFGCKHSVEISSVLSKRPNRVTIFELVLEIW